MTALNGSYRTPSMEVAEELLEGCYRNLGSMIVADDECLGRLLHDVMVDDPMKMNRNRAARRPRAGLPGKP